MIRISLAAGLLAAGLIATSPGLAAPSSDNPPAGKTEGIQISRAMALRNALLIVTGVHDKIVGQGGSQTVAHVLYEIDGSARWALNDDINALNAMLAGFDKTLEQMRAELISSNGGVPLPPKDEDQTPEQKRLLQKFNDDLQRHMTDTREVAALFHVKRSDFKEPIPGELMTPMLQAGIIDP